jgi:hypothetical protein
MLFIVSTNKVLIIDINEIAHCQVDLISKIEDDLTKEENDEYNIAVMDGYILLFSEKMNRIEQYNIQSTTHPHQEQSLPVFDKKIIV